MLFKWSAWAEIQHLMGSSLFVFIFIACLSLNLSFYCILKHHTFTDSAWLTTHRLFYGSLLGALYLIMTRNSTSDLFLEPKNGGESIVASQKTINWDYDLPFSQQRPVWWCTVGYLDWEYWLNCVRAAEGTVNTHVCVVFEVGNISANAPSLHSWL